MVRASERTAESLPLPTSNGTAPVDVAASLVEIDRAATRRRWPALVLGFIVGVGGTLAASSVVDRQDDDESADQEVVELAAAPVEQRDLVEEIEWSGALGYGEISPVVGTGGTVTDIAALGSPVERGDVLAVVDDQPLVVLFGVTPMWRSLSEGATGTDVLQLEANLAVLGYDPEQTVDIDQSFTANTAAMVERWQEDLGMEPTGVVQLGSVAIVEGPSVISSVVDVGSTANGQIASVAPRRAVIDVVAAVDGTVTSLAPNGATIDNGTVLYLVDEVPVIALVDVDPVARALSDSTYTGQELEQALDDGGYDPEGDMTVDGVITDATAAAIERWQAATGLPITGRTEPGYYSVMAADLVVEGRLVEDGQNVVTGGPVLTASISRLAVDVTVDVAEADEFEVDQEVVIELADETTAAGFVITIGPVVQPGDQQGSPTVDITIGVVTEAGIDPVEGPVTVISVGQVVSAATVVPTRSLVTLAEGGFAVEKIEADGSSRLVGIDIGSFDDGMVEVVSGDILPGDQVAVPQ